MEIEIPKVLLILSQKIIGVIFVCNERQGKSNSRTNNS
jgi:hypothetical protein